MLVELDAQAALAALERRTAPPERPRCYGDGRAGERVVAALPRSLADGSRGERRPIRVGVAGLGYWGPNLARNFAALPGCELAWLCDGDRRRAERVGASIPAARRTADLADLLADDALDAVVLATPVPTHAGLAERVLEAGKHCFVEKPLATTVADAERAVAAAERAGGC